MGAGSAARGGPAIEPLVLPGKAVPGTAWRGSPGLAASILTISRPGIAAAVAFSGFSGMVLAERGFPPAGPGAVALSCILAAACGSAIVNGVLDADTDARMRRLDARVSALGRVGRKGALAFAVLLILASLAGAFLLLNAAATALLIGAVASYTLLYTLVLKRRSPYGTIPGGIPGALPVLIGYAAFKPALGADAVLLFFLMLLWQPPHFWALALMHQDDYRAARVPVMPVAMGETYTKILIVLYAASLLPLSLGLWLLGACSAYFAAAALLAGAGFLLSCYRDVVASPRFGRAFGASILYIMCLLAAVIADVALLSPR